MKIKLLFTAALYLLFSGLQADCVSDQPLTLAELVNIALENNPSTKQAWWNANRAAAAVGNAKSNYYPNIGFAARATNGRDFKFINGPDTSYTIVGADLYLTMLLFDFGERKANVDMAKSSLLAANWQMDWNIQKVMVKVLEHAYSTLLAQEILQAAEISLKEAEKMLNAAKELNRTGLTPVTDVYTTQATYLQFKMDLLQEQASLDIQKAKLAASLGLSATTPLTIEVPETAAYQQIECTELLVAAALRQRSDLVAKQARVQQLIFNQIRTNASYLPKVGISGAGGYNKYLQDKSTDAQYRISIDLKIPFFNGFETMYQNRMAYADTQISNTDLLDLQIDISLEVMTHSRTLQAAQEMLPEAEQNLKSAVKAYEGVLDKYKAGKEGITEVSWAQRQLAAARVRYSEVKTKLLVSIANLAYATGTLAPYTETPCQENH